MCTHKTVLFLSHWRPSNKASVKINGFYSTGSPRQFELCFVILVNASLLILVWPPCCQAGPSQAFRIITPYSVLATMLPGLCHIFLQIHSLSWPRNCQTWARFVRKFSHYPNFTWSSVWLVTGILWVQNTSTQSKKEEMEWKWNKIE